MKETSLQHLLLARYAHALPELRLFRRNIVAGQTAAGTYVTAGIKGQADLYGYWSAVTPAIAVEVELKSAGGTLSEHQVRWREFCESRGIVYLTLQAKRTEDPNETIERWIRCLSEALQPYRQTTR